MQRLEKDAILSTEICFSYLVLI